MNKSYRLVGSLSPEGKMTERRIDKEVWNGCPCLYPGRGHCDCPSTCPCCRVSPSRQITNAFAQPFGA